MVTKAMTIDFWAFNGYEQWLAPITGMINNHIWATCDSSIFDDGPQAILPDASPTGCTYVSGAGLSFDGMPTTTITSETLDWWPFSWSDGVKFLGFNLHGLSAAPSSLGNSESSHWQSLCTAS